MNKCSILYTPQTSATLSRLSWGVINVKPLKIWISESFPEENLIHPQHGCVKVGLLLPWHRCQTAGLCQCSWESSILLGMTAALHLPGTGQYRTKGESTLIAQFPLARRNGLQNTSWHVLLNFCGFLLFLQNKFWQLKNNSYRTFYRNLTMDVKRLYNFSQGLETWIWIKLNKKYCFSVARFVDF